MPDSGQISGTVFLRPVRVGLVFRPSATALIRAVEYATASWGGKFHAFLAPEPPDESLALARSLGVDVIWPVDDDFLSDNLSKSPGFWWTGWQGPFEAADTSIYSRLALPAWLLDEVGSTPFVLPRWNQDDPLHDLFATWFGVYADSEPGPQLAKLFAERAEQVNIDRSNPIPSLDGHVTPLELTGLEVVNKGEYADTGIVLLDPGNAADLVQFWNLRAIGSAVFPWPVGFETRFESAADAWLTEMFSAGKIRSPRSGAGVDLGPFIHLWFGQECQEAPPELAGLLERRGIRGYPGVFDRPRWWTGDHPLDTNLSRSFTAPIDGNQHRFTFPLPLFPALHRQRIERAGVVAAQVVIYSETGLDPYWTANVPNVRELARLFRSVGEPFHYPTHNGHALGVVADADTAALELVSTFSISELLLRDSEWKCSQSDDGRFATQLIELLGGRGTAVANQPALRAVVQKTARTQQGLPLQALVQEAKDNTGAWPSPLMRVSQDDYAKRVVNHLLAKRILHPTLPVRCPNCATISPLRPEDLATEITCAMCSQRYPLGLALSLAAKKPDWHYRLAANVPDQRLSEALPVMATVSVMSSFAPFSGPPPHVLGLQVEGSDLKCEIDIALAMNDGGPAIVVVGEVKSFLDPIDSRDLANLAAVQQYLRTRGIDCYVLAATLRGALSPEEVADLRAFCETANSLLQSVSLEPLLPIVLTREDLSVPHYSDDHPAGWARPGWGMAALAMESCKRNLGLLGADYCPNSGGDRWLLRWADSAPLPPASEEPN